MEDDNYLGSDETKDSKDNTFTKKDRQFGGFKAYITDPETGEETPILDEDGEPMIFESATDMAEYFEGKPGGTSIRMEAQWFYTVTYIDPATGRVIQEKQNVDDNDPEPPAPEDPTRKGFTFGGWVRKDDGNGNITYEATWVYTVTYIDPATGRVIMETVTLNEGDPEPPAPKDPTREGYTFAGWTRTVDEFGNIVYLANWTKVVPTNDRSNALGYSCALILGIAIFGYSALLRKRYN